MRGRLVEGGSDGVGALDKLGLEILLKVIIFEIMILKL